MSEKLPNVVVSGYYGFDNLGDEAILEQLVCELKRLVPGENIIVLSANPQNTASSYQVRALARNEWFDIFREMQKTRLFVSGGGGLFQNTRSLGSILFYGLQILLARAGGARVVIYAQGLGPLNGIAATNLCRQFFSQAQEICLRDEKSLSLLKSWGLEATQTADPVWSLQASALPSAVDEQLRTLDDKPIALSLRETAEMSPAKARRLAEHLLQVFPEQESYLLLSLQDLQDLNLLQSVADFLESKGKKTALFKLADFSLPSQWLGLFSCCRALVGMRLHACIMALKMGCPVAGIAYDPKVRRVLEEFGQPILNLTNQPEEDDWLQGLQELALDSSALAERAVASAKRAAELAGQNFLMLERNLDMQRGNG